MMNRWYCVLGLLLLFGSVANAQEDNIQFERLNLEDGLSQGTIYCMLQDQKGLMWFGTQDGLNKYDGYTFTVYRYNDQDPNGISDIFIQDLYEDHRGFIWVATLSGGLNRFDRSTENFTAYQHRPDDNGSLRSNKVNTIFEDGAHRLWVGTSLGLDLMNDSLSGFTHYKLSENRNGDVPVTCIYEDRHKNLWVGTEKGLNRYDR